MCQVQAAVVRAGWRTGGRGRRDLGGYVEIVEDAPRRYGRCDPPLRRMFTSFVRRSIDAAHEIDLLVSPATPGAFVRDIADPIRIETLRMAQFAFITVADETALTGIFGLWARLVFFTPTELRFQQQETHMFTCSQVAGHISPAAAGTAGNRWDGVSPTFSSGWFRPPAGRARGRVTGCPVPRPPQRRHRQAP